jgi:hypothetical protein
MRSVLFAGTLLLVAGGPAGAAGGPGEVAVCSPESYLPYVAVAQWSRTEPVQLTVLPLTPPLGTPESVALPEEMSGPVRLRCAGGSLDLWTSEGHLRIWNPAARSPSVEPAPEALAPPDDEDFVHFACRNGRLTGKTIRAPRGRNRQLPLDLGRRYQPYRFGLRRTSDEAEGVVRWSLVVHEDRRRGTPNGRLSRSHVSREATALELACPRPENRLPDSEPTEPSDELPNRSAASAVRSGTGRTGWTRTARAMWHEKSPIPPGAACRTGRSPHARLFPRWRSTTAGSS